MFYYSPQEEIRLGPACWLYDYLRRSKAGGFFLPLSGGIDSCATAMIVYSMCQLICESNDAVVIEQIRETCDAEKDYIPKDPKELCSYFSFLNLLVVFSTLVICDQ